MGRKLKGAKLRAHKRGKDNADGMVDEKATQVESQAVVGQSNEELFVIDTKGDNKAKVPPQLKQIATRKQQQRKKPKPSLSVLDEKRVDALVELHDVKKLQVMAKDGQAKMSGDRRVHQRQLGKLGSRRAKFALWGDEDDGVKTSTAAAPRGKNKHMKLVTTSSKQHIKDANRKAHKLLQIGGIKGEYPSLLAERVMHKPTDIVAVDVARGGTSYRPDPKQYAQAVDDAVDVELRRQKAQAYKKAPLAAGLSAETRAMMVGDSSDEESGDEGDAMEDDTVLRKRAEKMTKAERNRQKRLRQERAMEDDVRTKKKMEKSVAEIPKYKKDIKQDKKERDEKKEQLELTKEKNKTYPGKDVLQRHSKRDPIHAPTVPVSLAAEHKDASLRTIIPKGSLVTDRMASFVDRNLVSKRKMGDKKRIMQGKRRKLNVKGKGYEIAREMDHKMMG